jgi:acyl-CoA thioesterase FadM
MNLFFRLLKVIFLLRLRPSRLQPLATSVLRLRAWPNDLDTNGHVNNGRYLTLMDLGRFDFLMRIGLGRAGFKGGWVPVLAASMVRFRRSLRVFEKVELRTRLLGWDQTWIYLEQTLANEKGLVAVAYLRGVFLRQGKKIPVGELLTAIGHTQTSPPLPEALLAWLKAEEEMYQNAKRRLYSGDGVSSSGPAAEA